MSDVPGGFRTDDPDGIAQRAVDAVLTLVRRGTALAVGVLAVVVVVCVSGFLLGYAALSGGMRTVWVVLGGGFAVLAIGAVVLAGVRLWLVRVAAASLVSEVRTLITGDRVSERTVIETVESTDGKEDESVVVLSRQFFTMREAVGDNAVQFVALAAALRAITTFPALLALATVISLVFFGLSILFLLALAL